MHKKLRPYQTHTAERGKAPNDKRNMSDRQRDKALAKAKAIRAKERDAIRKNRSATGLMYSIAACRHPACQPVNPTSLPDLLKLYGDVHRAHSTKGTTNAKRSSPTELTPAQKKAA